MRLIGRSALAMLTFVVVASLLMVVLSLILMMIFGLFYPPDIDEVPRSVAEAELPVFGVVALGSIAAGIYAAYLLLRRLRGQVGISLFICAVEMEGQREIVRNPERISAFPSVPTEIIVVAEEPRRAPRRGFCYQACTVI